MQRTLCIHFLVPAFGLGLLLWYIPGIKGETLVVGSQKPIFALVGDDVTLPCSLEPPLSAVGLTVEWTRPDLQPEYVHVSRDFRDEYDLKNPSYEDRTGLFLNQLKKGNVSLKLSRVKLSDEGKYRCFLPSLKSQIKESTIQLIVVSISQPKIITVESKASGVVLQCEAKSWYPEPEMEWREKEGRVLAAEHTGTVQDPDGRYTVTSHVTVQETISNWFICRVTLEMLNQSREEETHILAVYFSQGKSTESNPSWAIVWTLVAIGLGIILTIVTCAVVFFKYLKKYIPALTGQHDTRRTTREEEQRGEEIELPSAVERQRGSEERQLQCEDDEDSGQESYCDL